MEHLTSPRHANEGKSESPVGQRHSSTAEDWTTERRESPTVVYGGGAEPHEFTPLLLTVMQAAKLLGIGRTTLYKLMDLGEIGSVHVGSSRRIPLQCAHDYVERLCRHDLAHMLTAARPRRGSSQAGDDDSSARWAPST